MAAADGASALDSCMELVRRMAVGVAMDEPMVRFPKAAWAMRRPPSMPEGTGIVNMHSIVPDYNHFLGGVHGINALRVPEQQWQGEDVLR